MLKTFESGFYQNLPLDQPIFRFQIIPQTPAIRDVERAHPEVKIKQISESANAKHIIKLF